MQPYEQAVFISYAWGGEREEIVNQIDKTLQERGIKITRDKRDLGYRFHQGIHGTYRAGQLCNCSRQR